MLEPFHLQWEMSSGISFVFTDYWFCCT